MAKIYFEQLTKLIDELNINSQVTPELEIKHFFSGAALYANKTLCASWTPAGLAFKLPESRVNSLIDKGKAIPLKYFPNGHVKKGYVLFDNPNLDKPLEWKRYFIEAVAQV